MPRKMQFEAVRSSLVFTSCTGSSIATSMQTNYIRQPEKRPHKTKYVASPENVPKFTSVDDLKLSQY